MAAYESPPSESAPPEHAAPATSSSSDPAAAAAARTAPLERARTAEDVPDVPISPKDFLLSFRFAQGDAQLQRAFFTHYRLTHPGQRISEAQAAALFVTCRPAVQALVANPRRHHVTDYAPDGIDAELHRMIDELALALNHDWGGELPEVVAAIAEQVIRRDSVYLIADSGRGRAAPEGLTPHQRYAPDTDPYLSHLCYYVLDGRPTNSAWFDALFADVRAYVLTLPPDDPLLDEVAAVREAYALTHPQTATTGEAGSTA